MVSNRTRFKIYQAVTAIHVVVVAVPFIFQAVARMTAPPPKRIINIRLIEQNAEAPSDRNEHHVGGSAPVSVPDEPNRPDPPSQTPPAPLVPPKVVAPVITIPPPVVIKQPQVVKSPPKIVKSPPVAPRQPTVLKAPPVIVKSPVKPKDPVKPKEPSKPERDFKPISSNDWQDMNKPKKTDPQPTTQPPQQTSSSTSSSTTTTTSSKGGGSKKPGPVGDPGDNIAGQKLALDYSQWVGQFLKEQWEPPSRLQLGGREPEVTVTLYLAPSGQIISWKMVKPSGVSIMDNSVERLLRYVRKIPYPPPKGLSEITLIMVITD